MVRSFGVGRFCRWISSVVLSNQFEFILHGIRLRCVFSNIIIPVCGTVERHRNYDAA